MFNLHTFTARFAFNGASAISQAPNKVAPAVISTILTFSTIFAWITIDLFTGSGKMSDFNFLYFRSLTISSSGFTVGLLGSTAGSTFMPILFVVIVVHSIRIEAFSMNAAGAFIGSILSGIIFGGGDVAEELGLTATSYLILLVFALGTLTFGMGYHFSTSLVIITGAMKDALDAGETTPTHSIEVHDDWSGILPVIPEERYVPLINDRSVGYEDEWIDFDLNSAKPIALSSGDAEFVLVEMGESPRKRRVSQGSSTLGAICEELLSEKNGDHHGEQTSLSQATSTVVRIEDSAVSISGDSGSRAYTSRHKSDKEGVAAYDPIRRQSN